MSRLELAADRLKKALEGLEQSLGSAADDGEAAKLHLRVADLEAQREGLLEKVAELEEELAAMAGVTEEVEGRLDGAIGEIRAALART
jgi:hypothetical protein